MPGRFSNFFLRVLVTQSAVLATALPRADDLKQGSKRWISTNVNNTVDWNKVPITNSIIGIDSNMTYKCPTDQACWKFLVDTTQVCSFIASRNMSCVIDEKQTGCQITYGAAGDSFRSQLEVTNSESTCFYPQRKTEVSGRWAKWNGVGVTQLMMADKFETASLFYRGFDDFAGREPNQATGVLGFGEYSDNIQQITDDVSAPMTWLSFYLQAGTPFFSIAMPRGSEVGEVAIGGCSYNMVSMMDPKSNLLIVEPASMRTTTNKYGANATNLPYTVYNKPYAVNITDFDSNKPFNGVLAINTTALGIGQGLYVIDSLSPVIRTTPKVADHVAKNFEKPALQNGGKGDFTYYVDCDAKWDPKLKMGLRIGHGLGQTDYQAFNIAAEDMVVKMPNGKCVSAYQPQIPGDFYRLGWPFLKSNIVGFALMGNTTQIYIQGKK